MAILGMPILRQIYDHANFKKISQLSYEQS